jgi:acetyl-CoA C-acetyltransferase
MRKAFILGSTRTPIGSFLGTLSSVPAPKLGGAVIRHVLEKTGVKGSDIDSVYVGNVLSTGLGQNPAKQCAIEGGMPVTVPCTLISKVCGSSMKALILAAQEIRVGDSEACLAVGIENMSLAPRFISNTRIEKKLGSLQLSKEVEAADCVVIDGLWDSFCNAHMGELADQIARDRGISREDQDAYVLRSFERSQAGWASGRLDICPMEGMKTDEPMSRLMPQKLPNLPPCFSKGGVITAANASGLSDGAAALLVVSENFLEIHNVSPVASIVAHCDIGCEPNVYVIAPVYAARTVLKKADMRSDDIDLWEVNEAFAMVPLLFVREMEIDMDKVNVLGGALAVGHPLGCTGIRIVNTLISALRIRKKKYGMAVLCNGGGGATAVIIENLEADDRMSCLQI